MSPAEIQMQAHNRQGSADSGVVLGSTQPHTPENFLQSGPSSMSHDLGLNMEAMDLNPVSACGIEMDDALIQV